MLPDVHDQIFNNDRGDSLRSDREDQPTTQTVEESSPHNQATSHQQPSLDVLSQAMIPPHSDLSVPVVTSTPGLSSMQLMSLPLCPHCFKPMQPVLFQPLIPGGEVSATVETQPIVPENMWVLFK